MVRDQAQVDARLAGSHGHVLVGARPVRCGRVHVHVADALDVGHHLTISLIAIDAPSQ